MKVQVEGILGQRAESLERSQEVVESRGRNLEPQQVYFSKGHTQSAKIGNHIQACQRAMIQHNCDDRTAQLQKTKRRESYCLQAK